MRSRFAISNNENGWSPLGELSGEENHSAWSGVQQKPDGRPRDGYYPPHLSLALLLPLFLRNSITRSCVQTAICGAQHVASNSVLMGLRTANTSAGFNYGKPLGFPAALSLLIAPSFPKTMLSRRRVTASLYFGRGAVIDVRDHKPRG